MFSVLWNNVFPALGRFFGMLGGIAFNSWSDVTLYMFGESRFVHVLPYTNVFTGQALNLVRWTDLIPKTSVLSSVIDVLNVVPRSLCTILGSVFGLNELPFVFALLIVFSCFFFALVFFRFITSLF